MKTTASLPLLAACLCVPAALLVSELSRPADHVQIRMLNSRTRDCAEDEVPVWRLEVRSSERVDTLRNVVEPWPFVVGDSEVVGVMMVPGRCNRQLFRYDPRTAQTTRINAPADMWTFFSDLSISPDGRNVLYVAADHHGNERTTVRRWPGALVVIQGPIREECECDVDRHHAHWVSADSFELGTRVDPDSLYERISGSLAGHRIHVDTLQTGKRYWHGRAP